MGTLGTRHMDMETDRQLNLSPIMKTMRTALLAFLKKYATLLLMAGGLSVFILISGTSGSCGMCAAITQGLGIPSLIPSAQVAEPAHSAERTEAPAWKLKNLDGKEVSSTDFKGKVVMIDFWATWCPPCRMMIPGMVELQEQYKEQGLVIIGISLDEKGPGVVREFNQEIKVNYISLMGSEDVVRAFGGVEAIPTSFLIDRAGRIVSKHVGYQPKAKLEAEIKPLL